MTSESARQILESDSELTLCGIHIGLIAAKKNARLLQKWVKNIKKKISIHKKDNNWFNYIFHYSYKRKFKSWDYLGNSILKYLLKNKSSDLITQRDVKSLKLTPEVNFARENNLSLPTVPNYINFYFKNNYSEYSLKDNCGMIYLHNSWTPKEFKKMKAQEFLNTNNTLSNIFVKLLGEEYLHAQNSK